MAAHRSSPPRNRVAWARSHGIQWGDRAVSWLHVPRGDARQLAAQVHAHAAHALVHRLDPATVIQPDDRLPLREHALRRSGVRGYGDSREILERLEKAEPQVAGNAHDRGREIVSRAVHTTQKCRQLELPHAHLKTHRGESRLEHLPEPGYAATNRYQLEPRRCAQPGN